MPPEIIFVEFVVSVIYIYVEAPYFVHVGYCLNLFDDIVYGIWNKIFCCEEGDL